MVHLPVRTFEGHEQGTHSVAVFPDGERMVCASFHKTLRLYDLKTGIVSKKMEEHRAPVYGLAVSPDGNLIASGDQEGEIIAWHGGTGESVTKAIKAHSREVKSLDFSPGDTVLATGSSDDTVKIWNTKTWQMQGNPIQCSSTARCVRYSPSGEILAIATDIIIQIYNAGTRHCIANLTGRTACAYIFSLAWTLDSTRLLSGASVSDPSIWEWDTSTWKVGNRCRGHTSAVFSIAIHPAGTLVASASGDKSVRLWKLSDGQTIAVFQSSDDVICVTFSKDGKHIFSGGCDNKISEWAVPEDALNPQILSYGYPALSSSHLTSYEFKAQDSKILAITTTARNACVTGDLSTAEEWLTKEIDADINNYTSYANRAFVMARKLDWDHALQDAIKSVTIKPSLLGYISKGIALYGKGQIRDARKAFDFAFVSANGDSRTAYFLFLIKAIVLFNANEHEEALQRVQELAVDFPDIDPLACCVVEAYLYVQLGTIASDGSRYDEAVDHFTTAVNASAAFRNSAIHLMYEELVVLFGWDLETLWQIANGQLCLALVRAGRLAEAFESYRSMIDASDEITKASLRAWFSSQFFQ
ncbi:quinon protein alcohol dehydrogenase-like superfamily [Suillus spraguei]|nr:quinon protein alcohol dehydrogenase-like superfamily [Suillus spraguei]